MLNVMFVEEFSKSVRLFVDCKVAGRNRGNCDIPSIVFAEVCVITVIEPLSLLGATERAAGGVTIVDTASAELDVLIGGEISLFVSLVIAGPDAESGAASSDTTGVVTVTVVEADWGATVASPVGTILPAPLCNEPRRN